MPAYPPPTIKTRFTVYNSGFNTFRSESIVICGLSDWKVNIPSSIERSLVLRKCITGAQRQADGRARILAAALDVFATSGFEGASLRRIADEAGVMHQLVVYHFKTKEALWRATIISILGNTSERIAALRERIEGECPAGGLRIVLREFVTLAALRPEFHRIATFEGRADNERIRWLIETYMRPYFEFSTGLIRAAQAAGGARQGDPGRLHYAVIGLVTTSFVFAYEYRAMTELEPFDPDEIEKIANLACDFLGVLPEAED